MAAAEAAEAEAADHAKDLARLSVADAARREWLEAAAEQEATAREAAAELQRRGLAERIPVTDAEIADAAAAAAAAPREDPAIDAVDAARWKAEQTARVQADREADAAKMARFAPVTDAEIADAAAAAAAPREDPAIDPADAARWKAEQTARVQADREADAAKMARFAPVTDAEIADAAAAAAAAPREDPAIDPADAARWKAEQTARVQADREADAAKMARFAPVTDAEIADAAAAAAAAPREDPAIDQADAARWKAEDRPRPGRPGSRRREGPTHSGAGRVRSRHGRDPGENRACRRAGRPDA